MTKMKSRSSVPSIPANSRFGWPKPSRIEEFRRRATKPAEGMTRLVFQGKVQDRPIITVPIELPKYRMWNGRTTSLQAEYIASHPKTRKDIFSGDPELWDAQEAQHKLLLEYAQQSNLLSYFEDPANRQVEPILLDENGFVVNGNRRLSTWRELLFKNPKKFGHFSHIAVAILPRATEKEIDQLEVKLQIEQDIQADYIWHAHANMMLAQQGKYGYSNKQLGLLHHMKEPKVQELFDMRSYAAEYLRLRSKADHWSLVTEHEYAFRRIVGCRQKIKGIADQEVFKLGAFSLLDSPDAAGVRLYEAIPALAEGLEKFKSRLQAAVVPKAASPSKASAKAKSGKGALEALFGGEGKGNAGSSSDATEAVVVKHLQKTENTDAARKLAVETIQSERQLKRDLKSAAYLLNCCADAQRHLAAAIKDGLRPESSVVGVKSQLDEILAKVRIIRAYVVAHAKG